MTQEKAKTRTEFAAKNIAWGLFGNLLSLILHFINRTIFIKTIGILFLGINGLFTSVLGLLSLTELGIGTALNFSLYKPVVNKDYKKIKALMSIYKKTYYIIAFIIALLGLAILPLLPYIIEEYHTIDNLWLYYLIFLFNTVTSYFVSYKYGLVNAEQKGYIIARFESLFTIVISGFQIIALLLFKNYLVYLITQSLFLLIQKISIDIYLRKKYKYLKEYEAKELSKEEKKKITKDVGGLVLHKLGEVSIYQTDNIIISAFISTALVGIVSNYNLIITSVTSFIAIVFNSVVSGMGNLIASESTEKQEQVFRIYNFLGFWLYGFASICYWIMFQPFITLWVGEKNLIDIFSLLLIVFSQYFTGMRLTINNIKVAGGIFRQDRYISLIQGAINLALSIVLVFPLGLKGIYIGTLISGLFANIARPIIVYKHLFKKSAKQYFCDFFEYLLIIIVISVPLTGISSRIIGENVTWLKFIIISMLCLLVPNATIYLLFKQTAVFQELKARIIGITRRFKKKQ